MKQDSRFMSQLGFTLLCFVFFPEIYFLNEDNLYRKSRDTHKDFVQFSQKRMRTNK